MQYKSYYSQNNAFWALKVNKNGYTTYNTLLLFAFAKSQPLKPAWDCCKVHFQ